jgi:chromosomal replication initiator protein
VNEVFNQVMAEMKERLEPPEFQRWFQPLFPQASSGDSLIFQVPNIFFKSWITDHYLSDLERIASDLAGKKIEVSIDLIPADAPSRQNADRSETPRVVRKYSSGETGLNEKQNFDNFIVGKSNQLAHAASEAVANRSAIYNPLFIYGPSGLGKTHLLNAIGNALKTREKDTGVVYLSLENFTNEMVEAIRTEEMNQFRQKYRNVDVLLIDDIHFIGGKKRTQEEFFYTFNALYEADKQIVMTSDKVPKQISDLEERLRSRFEGGLFADILIPDQETKMAILTKKAEERNIAIDSKVMAFLSSNNESNIRTLEGYLARLAAYSSLTKKPINMEMAQQQLSTFFGSEKEEVTLDQILRLTAGFFNIKISDLKSSKKHQAVAIPRQAAMYLARKLTSLSTVELGKRMGGRDHSTVIHAVKRVHGRMEKDNEFAKLLKELEQTIINSVGKM